MDTKPSKRKEKKKRLGIVFYRTYMYGYHAIPTFILIRDLNIGKLVVPNTKGDKSNLHLSKKERKVSRTI